MFQYPNVVLHLIFYQLSGASCSVAPFAPILISAALIFGTIEILNVPY
jgi:hypothetical protein